MSYLWCGGEDIDFPNGSTPVVSTTAGRFRSGFGRCAMWAPGNLAFCASTPFPGGTVTSCWLSYQVYNANNGAYALGAGLGQSGQGGKGVWVGINNASQVTLNTYNGTTATTLATSAILLSVGAISKIDLSIASYGSSATVTVYINGSTAITYSGSVAVSGVTALDTVLFGGDNGGVNLEFSEFIVATTDTRSVQGLVTMAPNGNGTTQSWTNPADTNFNPAAINDANSTYTNTTGQDEQATLIDLPAGNFSVPMVKIAARALATTGAASTNLKLGVNNGGTVAVGSSHALTTAFSTYEDYFTTDPTTGSAWTQAEMNGLQLDLRSA